MSYHLDLGDERILALGLSLGFESLNFKPNWTAPDSEIDPLLPTSVRGYLFTPNVGLVYKAKKITLGLSATKFIETKSAKVNYSSTRNYYLSASYDFDLSDNFTLKPQILIRTDIIFLAADINLLAIYKKEYWLGVTNRNLNSFCFMAGIDFKEKYRVGYSYDLPISKLSPIFTDSHEIVLGFLLK